jgi:hypothetical protein
MVSLTSWLLCIVFVLALGVGVADHLRTRALLRPIMKRPCAGIRWRRRFPDASPNSIRSFLALFADAFVFPTKYKNRLRPNDRVMDIYRLLYPPGWLTVDAMEIETLASELERKYGFTLEDEWHDKMTLGELFGHAEGRISDGS